MAAKSHPGENQPISRPATAHGRSAHQLPTKTTRAQSHPRNSPIAMTMTMAAAHIDREVRTRESVIAAPPPAIPRASRYRSECTPVQRPLRAQGRGRDLLGEPVGGGLVLL